MKKSLLRITAVACMGIMTVHAQKVFLDQSTIDHSIKPGDDFFGYGNGAWIKANTIPATEPSWGNWAMIKKQTNEHLQQLVAELSLQKNEKGSNAQKVQDFYKSGMDTLSTERQGLQPLAADLKRIEAIKNKPGIIQEVIAEYSSGLNPLSLPFSGRVDLSPLFTMRGMADPVNGNNQIIVFAQGGMGLPEKSYYIKEDEKSISIRNKYVTYMQQLLQLSGMPTKEANEKAQAILLLETALAKAARTATENRDIAKLLNYFTKTQLESQFPLLSWTTVFQNLNIDSGKILVSQPEFFKALNNQLAETSLATWKDYLKVKLLGNAAPYLSSPFVKADFGFYTTALSGQTGMKPRGEVIVNVLDSKVGEALGKLYIEKYFTTDAKKRIDDLVQNVITTFGERIKKNDWMTDSTKEKALQKLSALRRKIAYPDKWRDYTSLTIGNNYYENVKAASAFNFRYEMNLIGKPVNRDMWQMTPPTLNAYSNSRNNEIVFPAGILLAPFFDKDADDAVNYGGIATVIGHEISHGFDDQGSKFDALGKFNNWWTNTDKENFQKKGNGLAQQFDQYVALDTLHVNGRLTLGENIGDLCGVTVAYEAFKKTPEGQSSQLIDGLTPDQRFFLSWATIWRTKQRDESLRTQVLTNPHSPARFRVNGPLSNLASFYNAFDVKEGDKMWRPANKRIVIW